MKFSLSSDFCGALNSQVRLGTYCLAKLAAQVSIFRAVNVWAETRTSGSRKSPALILADL